MPMLMQVELQELKYFRQKLVSERRRCLCVMNILFDMCSLCPLYTTTMKGQNRHSVEQWLIIHGVLQFSG